MKFSGNTLRTVYELTVELIAVRAVSPGVFGMKERKVWKKYTLGFLITDTFDEQIITQGILISNFQILVSGIVKTTVMALW